MNDPFDLSNIDVPPARPAFQGPPPYFKGLNDPQREAVEALDGPVLVLAGAGTGKTRVLTTRLAHLLATGRANPWQILCVTFTNRAAREMKERVGRTVGDVVEGMQWLGTFHAVAAKILRRHAELVGLKSNFTILDTDDQIRLLKQLISAANIDEKRWPARMLAGVIDSWKNRGLAPDKVGAGDANAYADGRGLALYRAYQDRLRMLNAADFGDLLLHCLTIFQGHPDVLADYHRRFKYILVDEYQDTNVAQYLWLRLLAQKHKNICCVGDDDQSIYGWRGAEVGNILRFESDFPGARIIRLEQNYRSTTHILGASGGLIATNTGRLGKTLWTAQDGGDKVTVRGVWDGAEEARVIAEEIENLQRAGHPLHQTAILVRAGFQTREFEDRFLTIGLPYRIVGGLRFYERQEIRDAMAYMRLVAQPDDDLAFERIINTPKRGLGDATLQALHVLARRDGIPVLQAAQALVETDELRPAARRALREFLGHLDHWRGQLEGLPHPRLAEMILNESGYLDMWKADKSPDAPGRLDNLTELVRAMESFENLAGFLEHISLVMENEEQGTQDKINVMTLHGAKGLEFDTVFLPGWEEGVFPNQRSLDEGGTVALEEERRLAYVGLTRARRQAHILFAANRRIFGQWQSAIPSRFIDELPPEHIEMLSQPGLYGGRSGGFGAEEPLNWPQKAPPQKQWPEKSYSAPAASRYAAPVSHAKIIRKPAPQSEFKVGARIFHDKFGYGTVASVDGNKLDINFDHSSPKKVIDSFVKNADDI
jgi:DNA helicase-2/ATP-dependent DNA helicase PcrA